MLNFFFLVFHVLYKILYLLIMAYNKFKTAEDLYVCGMIVAPVLVTGARSYTLGAYRTARLLRSHLAFCGPERDLEDPLKVRYALDGISLLPFIPLSETVVLLLICHSLSFRRRRDTLEVLRLENL